VTDTPTTGKTTRAQRLAMPLAREVVRDLAIESGACIRPVQLRRRNLDTGEVDQVLVPCGNTLASACPACAERARNLRASQCREGWHLEDEPDLGPGPATEDQKGLVLLRAEAQQHRDLADQAGADTTGYDELIAELDAELAKAGIRGKAAPSRPARRHRSTRRRQDAPDLPRRKIDPRTVGKTYTAPDGKTFRSRDLSCARAVRAVLTAIHLGHDGYQAVTSQIGKHRNIVDRDRHRPRKSKSPSSFAHATARDTATRIAPAIITMANTPA
jgi:hypothetical protein